MSAEHARVDARQPSDQQARRGGDNQLQSGQNEEESDRSSELVEGVFHVPGVRRSLTDALKLRVAEEIHSFLIYRRASFKRLLGAGTRARRQFAFSAHLARPTESRRSSG